MDMESGQTWTRCQLRRQSARLKEVAYPSIVGDASREAFGTGNEKLAEYDGDFELRHRTELLLRQDSVLDPPTPPSVALVFPTGSPMNLETSTTAQHPTGHADTAVLPPDRRYKHEIGEENVNLVTYPEGGLAAWSVAVGSWCSMMAGLGLVNSVGVFEAYVSTTLLPSYSADAIGWIFGLYVFISYFCGVQIGPIFDARGPRELIILALYPRALNSQRDRVVSAFYTAIAHWFNRRRGTTSGFAFIGSGVGGVLFPLMIQSLLPKAGWAWTMRAVGFVLLVLCIVGVILCRSRLPPRKAKPAVRDMLPDPRILWDPAMAVTTAGVFFIEWAYFVPISYVPKYYLACQGLADSDGATDVAFAYQLLAILNAVSNTQCVYLRRTLLNRTSFPTIRLNLTEDSAAPRIKRWAPSDAPTHFSLSYLHFSTRLMNSATHGRIQALVPKLYDPAEEGWNIPPSFLTTVAKPTTLDLEYAQLLYDAGADVNHRDRYGGNAAHEFAFKWFLDHGGNVDIADSDGVTVRYLAKCTQSILPERNELIADTDRARQAIAKTASGCCGLCGRVDAGMHRCGRCKATRYCAPELRVCQKLDWQHHKTGCRVV
ncbi:major facilitator superfamily domain-containing protein [Mycena leptocephala]|nr:major facilitator superfamily domain-containing protein [Mycena leptocephala]